MDPKGHAAIVTGAASGLGAETAAQLAKAGAKVTCLDINMDGAKATAEKIGGFAVRCDVTSSDEAVAALKLARDKYGPARILVNCAGIGPAKRIVGRDGPMPLADYEKVIAINLTLRIASRRITHFRNQLDLHRSSRPATAPSPPIMG